MVRNKFNLVLVPGWVAIVWTQGFTAWWILKFAQSFCKLSLTIASLKKYSPKYKLVMMLSSGSKNDVRVNTDSSDSWTIILLAIEPLFGDCRLCSGISVPSNTLVVKSYGGYRYWLICIIWKLKWYFFSFLVLLYLFFLISQHVTSNNGWLWRIISFRVIQMRIFSQFISLFHLYKISGQCIN